MPPVLAGIRVLDFSQGFAGSLATMLMADNGAEVIKVEPPSGDPFRSMPAWIMWNRGKRSVILDLASANDREAAQRLAAQVDVIVENFRPGEAVKLGLSYDTLAKPNPRLVYCSITGMGPKGPHADLPAYESVVAARAGKYLENSVAQAKPNPAFWARPNGSYSAGNVAVQGIISALRVRDLTGKGQRVETSLYQGWLVYSGGLGPPPTLQAASAGPAHPMQAVAASPNNFARQVNLYYLVCRCKDGQWVQMTNIAARLFPNWMKAIGLGSIYEDPRFKGAPFTFADENDRILLRRMILEKMQEKTVDEWLAIFKTDDIGGDRFLTTQQFMDHPQTIENSGVVDIDDPQFGKTRQIGTIVRFEKSKSVIGKPAPTIGQHTKEVLAGLPARPAAAPPRRASAGKAPRHPLEGLTVLDFATWLAAPMGTTLLADLGARVIKVEPLTGDEFRGFSRGMGRTFHGKESLVVDLKNPEGQKLIHQLVKGADAVMHNMRGDAAARLAIDYATLKKINPNIVYHYAGSYGSTGPGAGRGAFHPTAGALSGGALWQLGKDNLPPNPDVPMSMDEIIKQSEAMLRANEGSPDVTSAIAVATALTMALYHKQRTGEGQYLETTMLISNGYMCSDDFIRYEGKPPRQELDRTLRGSHALNRMYNTRDGWVLLSCPLNSEWEGLCAAVGRTELTKDSRFKDSQSRQVYDGALVAALGLLFQEKSADDWESLLRAKGVPCVRADREPYSQFSLKDPGVVESGFTVESEQPGLGKMQRPGPAVTFSATPSVTGISHLFGYDTPRILMDLGLSREQVLALKQNKVIHWDPAVIV